MLNFKEALAATVVQEQGVARFLEKRLNYIVKTEDENNPFFDGTMYSQVEGVPPKTYELKDERRLAGKTGNHFLELRSRDKDSGISTTTADYWIIQPYEHTLFMIPTEELRLGVEKNNWKRVRGGDKLKGVPTSEGVLVPLFWIKEHPSTHVLQNRDKDNNILPIYNEDEVRESMDASKASNSTKK